MTEFEVATLELQRSMLMAQYAAVRMAGAVGFAQCALIGLGLFFMRRAAIARDKALDILMKQTEDNRKTLDVLMKRAEDEGLALRTLIERTSK